MLGKGKERPGVSPAPESPSLDVRLLSESSGGLLDMGDDSGFMNLTGKDLDKMNLVDTPPVRRIEKKSRMSLTSPSKTKAGGRPSWGPKSSPTKGKLRLFEGLDKDVASTSGPQVKRKERTLGGFGQDKGSTMRPRQSMFAKPSVVQSRQSLGQEETDINDKEEEGEDSFYKNPALSSSTGSVKDRVAAIEASRLQADLKSYTNGAESKEQMDNQLAELRKMNDVFEAYEGMLTASADQIETFAQRIEETNSLLDIYIDLMRQADRTQHLLLDSDWKGATEDESAHALALELAEREARRKREEAELAAKLAAERKREAEQARLAAEQSEQRRTSASIPRGGARGGTGTARGGSVRGRGAAPNSSRAPSVTRGRTVSTASSTREGISTASRGGATTTSSASGLNNRYASVRSSGYGPPR